MEHLAEKNQLLGFIQRYINEDSPKQTEQLKLQMWGDFTETEIEIENQDLPLFYLMNQYEYSPFQKELLFSIRGEYGNYYYPPADWWTIEKVMEYAEAGESSIKYVKDWFDYPYEDPIRVFYIPDDGTPVSSAQQTDGINVRTSVTKLSKSIGIAHEITHIMLKSCKISTKGLYIDGQYDVVSRYYLQEAFCEYVSFSFLMETDNPAVFANTYEVNPVFLYRRYGEKYMDAFLQIRETKENKNDATVLADIMALKEIEDVNHNSTTGSLEKNTEYLMNSSIISFFYYLYGKDEDKQAFIEFYKDPAQAEVIYGKELNGLIDEWLDYMGSVYSMF